MSKYDASLGRSIQTRAVVALAGRRGSLICYVAISLSPRPCILELVMKSASDLASPKTLDKYNSSNLRTQRAMAICTQAVTNYPPPPSLCLYQPPFRVPFFAYLNVPYLVFPHCSWSPYGSYSFQQDFIELSFCLHIFSQYVSCPS